MDRSAGRRNKDKIDGGAGKVEINLRLGENIKKI
jgi:hypothetical protein